jgi:hypothetical protein
VMGIGAPQHAGGSARMRLSATDAWHRAAVSDGWSVRLI